jgi:hypothetical protein
VKIIGSILAIIALFIIYQATTLPLIQVVFCVVLILLSVPLYKKCQNVLNDQPKGKFNTPFWNDLKCKLLMISYGIPGAALVVWLTT